MQEETRQKMDEALTLLLETALTVGEIADKLGYNKSSSFSTVFFNSFGMWPTDFKKLHGKDRLSKARSLLCTTLKSTKEIAAELEYANVSNFNSTFYRSTGKWPHQFRCTQISYNEFMPKSALGPVAALE
jgi:AraC-like DNA-binding protein